MAFREKLLSKRKIFLTSFHHFSQFVFQNTSIQFHIQFIFFPPAESSAQLEGLLVDISMHVALFRAFLALICNMVFNISKSSWQEMNLPEERKFMNQVLRNSCEKRVKCERLKGLKVGISFSHIFHQFLFVHSLFFGSFFFFCVSTMYPLRIKWYIQQLSNFLYSFAYILPFLLLDYHISLSPTSSVR